MIVFKSGAQAKKNRAGAARKTADRFKLLVMIIGGMTFGKM